MMPSARFADLENASVLITGGGSGIGAALTEGFVRQGAKVAFIDIAEDASKALCEDLGRSGNRPLHLAADLRDIGALRAAVAEATARHGPVTVLVNNAARDDRHAAEDVTPDDWDANLDINLRPHFFTMQAVVEGMKQAGKGSIVNFTSTAFMLNIGDMPAYTAAKAGVIGLTKGMAGRYGRHGIRVNAIAPGEIDTAILSPGTEKIVETIPLRRLGQPAEVAKAIYYLCTDQSSYVTGAELAINGGQHV